MSNRFCVILNQGNNSLTITTHPQGKVHKLRQGQLFIGGGTPYKTYNQGNESWHIIGHIDNLPLLNYLLFNYYPSTSDLINEEIIGLAVKRYGMNIIELLKGNFCIIHEDADGNLTLVTEDEDQHVAPGAPRLCGNNIALPACHSPAGHYHNQRQISVTRWRDNHLQFIKASIAHITPR
ncbi:carbapenam-3-carboxylate synthase domain-containing protein [Acerihabitans arboris]|uniref:DUF1933 domain-containing protein n=1 Tax=Acerihabitans arboris TaxID=2691583 RepID=A0A845SK74_9GAMM|nr:carbapenam-3-carboxylate synthase domain-containing protein [Acerihabitans arboris]NDL63647.1 DUF1933 domain-containing protein [Acerihabitans arboris]